MPASALHRLATACLLLLSTSACSTAGLQSERAGEPVGDSRFITADEILESGAKNAWEAIRLRAGLSMAEDSRGAPADMSMRGRSSFQLDDAPVVVVDGLRLMDLQLLRSLDARTISSIEFTNGIQGTLRYGTGSGGGAIVITTRTR